MRYVILRTESVSVTDMVKISSEIKKINRIGNTSFTILS